MRRGSAPAMSCRKLGSVWTTTMLRSGTLSGFFFWSRMTRPSSMTCCMRCTLCAHTSGRSSANVHCVVGFTGFIGLKDDASQLDNLLQALHALRAHDQRALSAVLTESATQYKCRRSPQRS